MITSGGNRNPANADRGGRTQHWRRGISSLCPAHHPSTQQTPTASPNSKPTSAYGSTNGTPTPNPSSGPKPPTRSSTPSPPTAHELTTHNTSRPLHPAHTIRRLGDLVSGPRPVHRDSPHPAPHSIFLATSVTVISRGLRPGPYASGSFVATGIKAKVGADYQ